MSPELDPAQRFVPVIKDFAEGRMEPAAWFAWWDEHAEELRAWLKPGWLLQLKPSAAPQSTSEAAARAVLGARYVLTALGVPHEATDRYYLAWQAERQAYFAERDRKEQERKQRLKPVVAALKLHFPRFAAAVNRRFGSGDELEPGASEDELKKQEEVLGIAIPERLKALFRCTRSIQLDGFSIGLGRVFFHESPPGMQGPSDGMLCFADYFLEADGDQMLFDPRDLPADDPPVFYYAHEVPEVRPLNKAFSTWLESLGRSPVFRD
jgi:hypothetical protein